MSYIDNPKLTDQDVFNFISSVLSSERAVFNNEKPIFINFNAYLQISSRDEQSIVVSSNYNCGLVSYNIFTLDDYNFKALYPLCQSEIDYTTAWRNFLANRFADYNQSLNKYLKKQGKHK